MNAIKQLTSNKRNELNTAVALILPAAIIMAVVTIYPLVQSFIISFRDWDLLKPNDPHIFVWFENYKNVLTDPLFFNSVKVTGLFVICAVSLEIIFGLFLALLLNREFVGRQFIRMIALLPWAVPAVVNGIMWKWILNPSYGALNGLLHQFGLIDKYIIWLGSPGMALATVVVADVWKETPFIMLLLLSALQTVPKDLYEAATVDGASNLQKLLLITIPLLRPTLFVAISLRTIWALKSFDLIYTLTAGGPSNATSVLGYYTYQKSFVSLDLGKGSAAAYIMTAIIMLVVILYQRAIYREVNY
ncbi:MAG: sugar ABC transporter permease [Chloroflexi bacterium HGW-Chloroflexi-10]|nr:MAG: sugar ABC transporter permease [Chloroflexi bacterium HGW-Chloroflexi-10]